MPAARKTLSQPASFLTVRTHVVDPSRSLCGLCVGYERGTWRSSQFVDHIVEWLPEFCLTHTELQSLKHSNAVDLIRRAAAAVYKTGKFKKRGEFGELFLHAAIRQVYNSLPAISKIYYKSARNDTVKGFDAVHIVGPPRDMELWLGEAKFYDDVDRAINDVLSELEDHFGTDYLRDEFLLIKGKIDDNWPHAEALKKLLSRNISLDEVFKRVCIPVLLTYDSQCVATHNACTSQYEAAFKTEVGTHYATFLRKMQGRRLPKEVRVHLILLPLHTKSELLKQLDGKLKTWQQL